MAAHQLQIDAFDQGTRGRHLIERVVLDAEVLGERALHEMVERRTAAARERFELAQHASIDAGAQFRHPGNVVARPIRGNQGRVLFV